MLPRAFCFLNWLVSGAGNILDSGFWNGRGPSLQAAPRPSYCTLNAKNGEPDETSPLHIPMTYHRPILAALTLAAILCLAWCVHPSVAPAAGRESWRALERFAERWHGLDRGLLKRASTMETDNRDLGCVKDANGCSCSRYQIYLPDCPAVVAEALTKSRALAAWWAAWRLAESKRRCTRAVLLVIPGQEPKRRCVCDWTFWNAGAEDAVCAKLAAGKGDES